MVFFFPGFPESLSKKELHEMQNLYLQRFWKTLNTFNDFTDKYY